VRTDLRPEEVAAYRENGFVVLDDFLDEAELARWRTAVDRAVAERGDRKLPGAVDFGSVDAPDPDSPEGRRLAYYERVFAQRMNLWQSDEEVRELVFDPRIGRVAATLAGVSGVRIFHDQALIKPAWGNPTAYHLDVPYWSFTSPDAISVWIALDDATLANGCLCYVPGSHKVQRYDNSGINDELGGLFARYPEYADVEPIHCPVRAGGAVLHNGLVAHGAGANMTPRPRRAMTVQFMPEGARFNGTQSVLPPAYVATLTVGDVLENDACNPLTFSSRR
jgi:ectoine hydroxylase-related dioxygenase (phytanoyl-CoA dioxygenase family)